VKKLSSTIMVLFAFALAGYVWRRMHPNQDRVIVERVEDLAERVTKPAGETNSIMALKMGGLSGLFADEVAIELEPIEGFAIDNRVGGDELASLITQLRTMFSELTLTCHDITVTRENDDEATATFTARLEGTPKHDTRQSETREIHAQLRQIDGKWRFTAFRDEAVLVK
jgi:hypothetical protein